MRNPDHLIHVAVQKAHEAGRRSALDQMFAQLGRVFAAQLAPAVFKAHEGRDRAEHDPEMEVDPHAALLLAQIDHRIRCLESGTDPDKGDRALHDLWDEPDELAAILAPHTGGDEHVEKALAYALYIKAAEHAPRGGISLGGTFYPGGRWIPSSKIASATPEEKRELAERKQGARPNPLNAREKAKAASEAKRGDRATLRKRVAEIATDIMLHPDARTPDHYRDLAEALRGDHLAVADLRAMRLKLSASFGGKRRRDEMVAALLEHATRAEKGLRSERASAEFAAEQERVARRNRGQKDKPTGKKADTILARVLDYGGIDPTSHEFLTSYEGVRQAQQDRIPLIAFRHGGRGLDQIARELETNGHIHVPDDEHPGSYVLDLLRERAVSLTADLTKEYDKAYDEYVRAREEAERHAGPDRAEEVGRGSAQAGLHQGAQDPLGEHGAGAGAVAPHADTAGDDLSAEFLKWWASDSNEPFVQPKAEGALGGKSSAPAAEAAPAHQSPAASVPEPTKAVLPDAKSIQAKTRGLADVISGKKPVGVEGRGGKDATEAKLRGLYTSNVGGTDIHARTAADAKPLEDYLRGGGKYGTPEFSRLLGYSPAEIEEYKQYLNGSGQHDLLTHDDNRHGSKPDPEANNGAGARRIANDVANASGSTGAVRRGFAAGGASTDGREPSTIGGGIGTNEAARVSAAASGPSSPNVPADLSEQHASTNHAPAIMQIPKGDSRFVAGHRVRHTADGQFQVERRGGFLAGSAGQVSDHIRNSWKENQGWKSLPDALARAHAYDEPDPFTDVGRAAEDAKARSQIPDGTRAVSLDENTHGRVGKVKRNPETGQIHLQLDGGEESKANDFEPLHAEHSWRVPKAERDKLKPKSGTTGDLFGDDGEPEVAPSPKSLSGSAMDKVTREKEKAAVAARMAEHKASKSAGGELFDSGADGLFGQTDAPSPAVAAALSNMEASKSKAAPVHEQPAASAPLPTHGHEDYLRTLHKSVTPHTMNRALPGGELLIDVRGDQANIESNYAHEAAHNIHDYLMSDEQRSEWDKLARTEAKTPVAGKKVSHRGTSGDPAEDFPEVYAAWTSGDEWQHDRLRPAYKEFMQRNFGPPKKVELPSQLQGKPSPDISVERDKTGRRKPKQVEGGAKSSSPNVASVKPFSVGDQLKYTGRGADPDETAEFRGFHNDPNTGEKMARVIFRPKSGPPFENSVKVSDLQHAPAHAVPQAEPAAQAAQVSPAPEPAKALGGKDVGANDYRAAQKEHSQAVYDAIQKKLNAGEPVDVLTSTRRTRINPDARHNLRIRGGEIEMRQGKQWGAVTGSVLDRLAAHVGAPKSPDPSAFASEPAQEPETERAPHEMTPDEFKSGIDDDLKGDAGRIHRQSIQNALTGGFSVPSHVLAHYPDLVGKPAAPSAPPRKLSTRSFRRGAQDHAPTEAEFAAASGQGARDLAQTPTADIPAAVAASTAGGGAPPDKAAEPPTKLEEGVGAAPAEKPIMVSGHSGYNEFKMPKPVAPNVSPDHVPLATAQGAYRNSSWHPERRGYQEQADYVNQMNADWEHLSKYADTPEKQAQLKEEFERYRQGYLSKHLARLHATGRTASSMITGPSKFPVAQNRKRLESEHKRSTEHTEFRDRALKAIKKKLRPEVGAIQSNDPNAVSSLERKLESMQRDHAHWKSINAAHKAFLKDPKTLDAADLPEDVKRSIRNYKSQYSWEPHPIAPYQFTNHSANMRRVQGRIDELKKMQGAEAKSESWSGGVKVEESPEDARIRIKFPGKPTREMIDTLKSRGFRWSPSVGAWQRHLNNGGRHAVESVLKQHGHSLEAGAPAEVDDAIPEPVVATAEQPDEHDKPAT